jgi:hypothetical protein
MESVLSKCATVLTGSSQACARGSTAVRCSHGVLAGPLAGGGLVLGFITLVLVSDVGNQRIVGVGIGQQRADRQQDLGDSECGGPLVLQDVKADGTVRIDVRVVNLRHELELWWLEGVVGGEVDIQEEHTTSEGGVLGSHDSRLPVERVRVVLGAGAAVSRWVFAQVDQFFCDSLKSHIKL